jgi:hypothetical protein
MLAMISDSRNRGNHTHHDEDSENDSLDIDSRQPSRFLIPAYSIGVATEAGVVGDVGADHRDDGQGKNRILYAAVGVHHKHICHNDGGVSTAV